jgi:hypothetical protein
MPEAYASVKQLHSSKEKILRWHLELCLRVSFTIEGTIEELWVKRKITGLTPRRASKRIGITESCSLEIQQTDKGSKAQTCVLFLRTLAVDIGT